MAAKTQALAFLDAAGVPYELLEYAAHTDHFGDHAVAELGIDPAVTLKTLVIHHERDFAVCCVPVAGQLSLKKAAKALGWKNAEMAAPKDAQRVTGYIVGGISPLGTKQALPTLIDASLTPLPYHLRLRRQARSDCGVEPAGFGSGGGRFLLPDQFRIVIAHVAHLAGSRAPL